MWYPKLVLILVTFDFVVVYSAPPVQILKQEFDNNIDNYKFSYETSDGQKREETGKSITKGDEELLQVVGSYSFIGLDGRLYSVTYTADENGYQANTQSGPANQTPRPGVIGFPPASAPIPTAAVASLNGGGFGK